MAAEILDADGLRVVEQTIESAKRVHEQHRSDDTCLILIGVAYLFAVARSQHREIEFLRRELGLLRKQYAELT